jgi:inner membrane protein
VDPLTQGLLGAAAAQAVLGRRFPRAWLVGAVGGMAADLDVLVRSASDPLLAVQAHRQFTHALLFIPVGGAAAALPWLASARGRARARQVLAASTIGYATHGLLDACTTYGTQLLWPLSTMRVAWSWISILDPLFTLVLAVGVVLAARAGRARPALLALGVASLYLAAGAMQRGRALEAQRVIAESRGHRPERGDAFPTMGNNVVWRSLYQAGDTLYADRVRVGWDGKVRWAPGTSVRRATEASLGEEARGDARVVRDFRRFGWFSNGWVAPAPSDPELFGDARYSLRTDAFEPIWGVRFTPGAPVPTAWVNRTRDRSPGLRELGREVAGTRSGYRPLPLRRATARWTPRSPRADPSGPARGRTPPARPATAT